MHISATKSLYPMEDVVITVWEKKERLFNNVKEQLLECLNKQIEEDKELGNEIVEFNNEKNIEQVAKEVSDLQDVDTLLNFLDTWNDCYAEFLDVDAFYCAVALDIQPEKPYHLNDESMYFEQEP